MSIAAAAWGAPVNGVRLQIALTGNPQPEIGITAQNVDSKPLLLPIGALIGDGFYDIRPVLVLTAPGGKDRRAVYTCDPGVVGGRVDPLVVPLLPNPATRSKFRSHASAFQTRRAPWKRSSTSPFGGAWN